MIENLRHADPAPETDCRRTVLTDASSKIEKPHRYRSDRRKRYEILRRLKSLDKLKSSFAAGDHRPCFKRNRTENGKLFSNKKSDEEDEECPDKKTAVMNLTLQEPCNVGARDPNYSKYDVRCRSHGSISVIGRRREMEDTVAVELGFLEKGSKAYDFFGVYDGHGGSVVARACRDRLHRLLAEIAGREEDDDDKDCCEGSIVNWKKVMVEGFKKIDEEVNGGYMAEVATMGSTAVVAVVGEEELVVANCGDSRAVLSRGGVTVPLSDDHKPDRSAELERIELSGGKVINWNGQRVLGVLATSRSIGDRYLKPYIIPDPEVIVSKRSSGDEFLILASDGLWDVISNDVACQVVRKCLDAQRKRADDEEKLSNGRKKSIENGSQRGSPASIAARVLTKLAIARGSRDNISVIVVELRRC